MANTNQPLTLLIMAAGLGSRFGGLKQIEAVGPNKELLLDYAVYDAYQSGFTKVVVVCNPEVEAFLREHFGKVPHEIDLHYVHQEAHWPDGLSRPKERKKPWGTGHAVWSAHQMIEGPFAVINADDYYGAEAFQKLASFFQENDDDHYHAMVGYELFNTLSEFGGVSRGVVHADGEHYLKTIQEIHQIESNYGDIIGLQDDQPIALKKDTVVSMNCWGFWPTIFEYFEGFFREFAPRAQPREEFYIPSAVDEMIRTNVGRFKVLQTRDSWMALPIKKMLHG